MKKIISARKLFSQQDTGEKHQEGRTKLVLVVVVALILLVSGLQIYLSSLVATTGEKIALLEDEKSQLQTLNRQLKGQIDQSSSLSVIERRAREELNMQKKDSAFYYLTPDYLASLR